MCRSFKFGGNILYGTCSWHHLFSSGDARISYLGLTPPLAFLILSQCPLPFPSLLPPCTSILCSFRPSFRTRSLLIQPGKGSGERCKISACLGRQTLSAFWRFDFRPFQWSFWRFLLGIKSEKKSWNCNQYVVSKHYCITFTSIYWFIPFKPINCSQGKLWGSLDSVSAAF